MDVESEIGSLQAENVAMQAVLIAVCRRLARGGPELAAAICGAFDDAEDLMSGTTLRFGADAPIGHTVGALEIIEELRGAAIADERICRPKED